MANSFSKCEKFIGGNATLEPSHYRRNAKNSGGFGGLAPQFATAAGPNINSHLEKKFALGKPELLSIPVLEIMSQWADSTKTHDGIRKILSERNLKPGHK